MKTLKTLVALFAGLLAFTSVKAGELTVTGSMQATYQSEVDDVTGNPLGLNTDLKFSGSTDTDFGTATWTMATDGTFLGESGADHTFKIATDAGTFGIGNTGDAANAVDDITPTAFEEANGSGSGTYTASDVGAGMEGSMNLSYGNGDLFGTGISIAYNYYPNVDGTTNNEKASSTTAKTNTSSGQSVNVGIPLANLPLIGDSPLGGIKLTAGYNETDGRVTDVSSNRGGTVAINLPIGPLSVGYQKKAHQALAASVTEATKAFYKDDVLGLAYAVNDDFAISYNIYESAKHNHAAGEVEQETKSINLAYTIGGLTLAFADAKTDNAGYSEGTSDDTRTLSVKTAF